MSFLHYISEPIAGQTPSWILTLTGLNLQESANFATFLSLPIALIGALLAWISYKNNIDDLRKGKMHDVLRELLALEVQHPESIDRLIAFKFYATEEIFGWTKRHQRLKFFRKISREDWPAWFATIDLHLNENYDKSKEYFYSRSNIFEKDFKKYVESYYCRRDLEIKKLANKSKN